MTIINRNDNVICYDLKDVVTLCLRSTSQNDYNNFSPSHIPMKEYNDTTDENN